MSSGIVGIGRVYMNARWCSRCRKTGPTPYLRKYCGLISGSAANGEAVIVDIGCGNGRNGEFMRSAGYGVVRSFHMVPGYKDGETLDLGAQPFPMDHGSADVVLASYVLMFLAGAEVDFVLADIDRIARPGCFCMVELYPAKDCRHGDAEKLALFQASVFYVLAGYGWKRTRYSRERFIVRKGD